ncbi:hypothetical protein A2U01_0038842, partial [Trifolium medium]|nr:hypothetical protein [Trifolium medium]
CPNPILSSMGCSVEYLSSLVLPPIAKGRVSQVPGYLSMGIRT